MRQIVSLMLVLSGLSYGCAGDEGDTSESSADRGAGQHLLTEDGGRTVVSGDRASSIDGGAGIAVTRPIASPSTDDAGRCGAPGAVLKAGAEIAPKSGNTTLAGSVSFVKEGGGSVKLMLKVQGAPPGVHGAHIHQVGDCSAADATSAGGHWNPLMAMHGAPSATAHFGDLGNLTVAADGTGSLTLDNAQWALGDGSSADVIGKAIVIHANPDDLMTQPTGNAGGRIGCGVIAAR